MIRPDEMVEPGVFPVEPREVQEAEPLIEQTQGLLKYSECMALAIIAKDSSPHFSEHQNDYAR